MAKAKVTISAGICGFSTTVLAWDDEEGMIRLALESECDNIRRLAGELGSIDPMSLFTAKAKDSEVYAAAARCLPHQTCPVPVGILKAVEVAAGFALPRDVSMVVEKED